MATLKIYGGKRLFGELRVQGAKNACLPCLAAALLGKRSIIKNCPDLSDTRASVEILNRLGARTAFSKNTADISVGTELSGFEIPNELMKKMRSSALFLGAVLSRCRVAKITYPGGCSIGARPIDMHLDAFLQMGVEIDSFGDTIICAADKIKSCTIRLDFPSVGATENIMLLAARSDAEVKIIGAAAEPEILDLQNFINSMGGNIRGAGSRLIIIKGVEKLGDTVYNIMPDRIAALTYMTGVDICGGKAVLNGVNPDNLLCPIKILKKSGTDITVGEDFVKIKSMRRGRGFGRVETAPYPLFPTDAQALFMASAMKKTGESVFCENIFENRLGHAREFQKFGGDITVFENIAKVSGKRKLYGAKVKAADLRGGAALCVAALAASGQSFVEDAQYIDRGYESIEKSFGMLGGEIERIV